MFLPSQNRNNSAQPLKTVGTAETGLNRVDLMEAQFYISINTVVLATRSALVSQTSVVK
jgi:hypothetical protein